MKWEKNKVSELLPNDIAVVGLPFDDFSSYLKGPTKAPDKIREALNCGSSNWITESGLDLENHPRLKDLGDIPDITHPKDVIKPMQQILNTGAKILSLGGDHSLAYGTIKAHASKFKHLTVLQMDAHTDLYDEFEGNKFSHACPFARIMEEGLVDRLVQVGIRTVSPHQKEQAEKFGVEIIQMKDFNPTQDLKLDGDIYLSLDLDVLDPAFASGISHHEPGGMTTRQLLDFLKLQNLNLVGAEIMEYNPNRDINGMTGMVAALFYKEIAGLMLKAFS
ncbi:MAG: agmatinase [Cyclobacteriaceae bacterium]